MRELTKAEEQIMRVLWKQGKAFVKNIIDDLPEPKPAYNTVSTIVRILEKKGVVSHTAHGKAHEYFPLISKDDYQKHYLQSFMKRFFGGSFREMFSFFARGRDIGLRELEEIRALLHEEIAGQKGEK